METVYEKTPWGRAIPYTSPTGVETTLYNISTAADAIGRTAQTLRKWEIAGILPPTPFTVNNRRMYSTEHINAIVECAEKAKLKNGKAIKDTSFSKRLYKRFAELNKLFFGIEEKEEKEDNANIKKHGKIIIKNREA